MHHPSWLGVPAGSGDRTESSRLMADASRSAEEAASHAASAAAAASLGQSMHSAQGMSEAGQSPLNTVAERGVPCKVNLLLPGMLFFRREVSVSRDVVNITQLADSLHCSFSRHARYMQGPSKALEDRIEGSAEPSWPAMPKACSDALAAECQVWRLHSQVSKLALLTRRLFSAPEVRGIISQPCYQVYPLYKS